MRKWCLLIVYVLSLSISAISQSKKDVKTIEKILRDAFTARNAESYSKNPILEIDGIDTSLTHLDDTTGIYLNGEYLMFHSPFAYSEINESFKYVKNTPVTNQEYLRFKQWVQDSIYRIKVFYSTENEEEIKRMLNYSDPYFDHFNGEICSPTYSNREHNLRLFSLNWNYDIYKRETENRVYTYDMNIPPHARFYKNKVIDERKLSYRYYEAYKSYPESYLNKTSRNVFYDGTYILAKQDSIQPIGYKLFLSKEAFESALKKHLSRVEYIVSNSSNVATGQLDWARNSKHPFDVYSALSRFYDVEYANSPVIGVNGSQARAFCHWKTRQINKRLSAKRSSYRAFVTLPNETDVKSVTYNKKDLEIELSQTYQNWLISKEDYAQFIAHVQDSVLREILYSFSQDNYEAAKLLQHPDSYFDESILEHIDFNPHDREINRENFPFNYKSSIAKLTEQYCKKENISKANLYQWLENNAIIYQWYYRERGLESIVGRSSVFEDYGYKKYQIRPYDSLVVRFRDHEAVIPIGKDLDLSYTNTLGSSDGKLGHEDKSRFIIRMETNITTDMSTFSMKSLTYQQAIAFYNWKFPSYKPGKEYKWTDFIYPSEKEFKDLQEGILPNYSKVSASYPGKLFRYTVHFYDCAQE